MITIKIKNVREIVRSHRGPLAARFGSFFVDLESKVEEEIVRQLQEVFAEKNIDAEITIVPERDYL